MILRLATANENLRRGRPWERTLPASSVHEVSRYSGHARCVRSQASTGNGSGSYFHRSTRSSQAATKIVFLAFFLRPSRLRGVSAVPLTAKTRRAQRNPRRRILSRRRRICDFVVRRTRRIGGTSGFPGGSAFPAEDRLLIPWIVSELSDYVNFHLHPGIDGNFTPRRRCRAANLQTPFPEGG